MSYADLYARLQPWTERASVTLWERQMVLGPAPEFCLRTPELAELPRELGPLALTMEPIWP
jgi:hypothetical protein